MEVPAGINLFGQNMVKYGKQHAAFLSNPWAPNLDPLLAATYYDAAWVFRQIYEYRRDMGGLSDDEANTWLKASDNATTIYRDRYVIPSTGHIPGYWKFPHGLVADGSSKSADALVMMARNGAYAFPTTSLKDTEDSTMSREVAYLIMTALCALEVGEPLNPKYDAWIEQAKGHIKQWEPEPYTNAKSKAAYVRPFMVALTCQALIEHADRCNDGDTYSDIQKANHIMRPLWVKEKRAFKYTDREIEPGDMNPAPDLNLLIAPVYAYLGDDNFADEIFRGGVMHAFLSGAKQFNQNYRWVFSYLKWRKEARNSLPF